MERMNLMGNDMIQERSNLNFGVKRATIQFYDNNYNSQSNRQTDLKFYVKSPDILSYIGLKLHVNRRSRKHRNIGQKRLYEFCYLFSFNLWTSYLTRILFLK